MSKLSIAKRAEFVNGIYSDYCSDFLDDIHVALHDIAIHLARKDSEIEYDFDELLDTYFEELRDSFEIQEMSEIGERIFLLINSELPGNRQFSEIEIYSDFIEHEYIRMLLAKLIDKKGDSVSNIELSFLANEVLRIKNSLVHNHLSLEKITDLYFDNISRSNAEITKIINKFDFYGHKNF